MNRTEQEWLDVAKEYILQTRLDKDELSGPVLISGEGSVVRDVNGVEYLDFNSGQMCSALGHRAPRVVEAIKHAADTFIHASSSVYNVYEIELAEKLGQICPDPLKRSFFMESGADSNEAAMQVAKFFTGRTSVASPHTSFHGLSDGTRALTYGVPLWHQGYGPYAPGTHAFLGPYSYQCPVGHPDRLCDEACLKVATQVLDHQVDGPLAAIITEPLFSAGGVIEPPPGWLQGLRDYCDERGALLIFDEAQTGLGKLGKMWGFEHHGVIPDIMTVSKHFGGGVSVSAVITTDAIADKVQDLGFIHGHSHSSDPLACAAAVATIDTIVEDGLVAKAEALGKTWRAHLDRLAEKHMVIGDIRGRGLLQGIELVNDRATREQARGLGYEIERFCVEQGLFFSVRQGGAVLRFVPPWTTTDEQFEKAASILDAALEKFAS